MADEKKSEDMFAKVVIGLLSAFAAAGGTWTGFREAIINGEKDYAIEIKRKGGPSVEIGGKGDVSLGLGGVTVKRDSQGKLSGEPDSEFPKFNEDGSFPLALSIPVIHAPGFEVGVKVGVRIQNQNSPRFTLPGRASASSLMDEMNDFRRPLYGGGSFSSPGALNEPLGGLSRFQTPLGVLGSSSPGNAVNDELFPK